MTDGASRRVRSGGQQTGPRVAGDTISPDLDGQAGRAGFRHGAVVQRNLPAGVAGLGAEVPASQGQELLAGEEAQPQEERHPRIAQVLGQALGGLQERSWSTSEGSIRLWSINCGAERSWQPASARIADCASCSVTPTLQPYTSECHTYDI